MFIKVGFETIKPRHIGIFTGITELNLHSHGNKFPVSGWIAVLTTLYEIFIFLISYLDKRICFVPEFWNYFSSAYFYLFKVVYI